MALDESIEIMATMDRVLDHLNAATD